MREMVTTLLDDERTRADGIDSNPTDTPLRSPETNLRVSVLTGGIDRPYAFGLVMALIRRGVGVDVIGSQYTDSPEMHSTPNLTYFNLWPSATSHRGRIARAWRVIRHYASLLRYAAVAKPGIFHILWNSKIQFIDRTLLMLYYKALGKKVALTAHNVNQAKRDGKDSYLNRLTLRIQYHLTDHLFVHTQRMKCQLVEEFGVAERRISVIRHPLNDAFPDTDLTVSQAKRRLGLRSDDKALLCLGRIKPYKGIEHLLAAFKQLSGCDPSYRLIVAGEAQKGNEQYLTELRQSVARELENGQILFHAQFIPDEEMEIYLKAADVLILPYNEIFQSGVLFLGYTFGLPVIATDVGSFREEIVEGETGYLCRPSDPPDLAATIATYFGSELYQHLGTHRERIREYAKAHHSWGAVAGITQDAYTGLSQVRSL
jgi:glycosyltransferase involved in cell wall biosynthesis